VVADYDLAGNFREVIDEFPFFSFFLGDLHPHVLVIPFVFVALSLSLNLFLRRDEEHSFYLFGSEFLFSPWTYLLGAIVFGGLGFLNLWDFPWYVVIFAGAHTLKKADRQGWSLERLIEFAGVLLAFGLGGVLAYLPFYLSFSSQAGGILPNVINPTRGAHLWIMFGTLFVPLLAFLGYLLARKRDPQGFLRGLALAVGLTVLLLGFSLAFTSLKGALTEMLNGIETNSFLLQYGAESTGQLIGVGLSRRTGAFFSALTLIVVLGLGFAILWPRKKEGVSEGGALSTPHRFTVLLVVIAGGLVLAPEYFYLKDLFGSRMNTIFKFYYQAWILWAVAAAYGSAVLISQPKKKLAGGLYTVLLVAVLLVGLTYPAMALNTRISSFLGHPEPALKLDGADNNYYLNPDEQAAAVWLREAPLGTLVEAVHPAGGSYTHYARISMNTGQPALLGWLGHERQWRGGYEEAGNRQVDIERLYTTGSWGETVGIIEQYGIRYIVVGNLERTTYNVYEDKFIRNMEAAFQQGSITIYRTHLPGE
jgi:YYY domain-containing protein